MPSSRIFLDTAYAIALSAQSDNYHQRALSLAEQMEDQGTRLITTRAVILEIGNALAKLSYRQSAIALIESLDQDANVEIIPLTEELHGRAF